MTLDTPTDDSMNMPVTLRRELIYQGRRINLERLTLSVSRAVPGPGMAAGGGPEIIREVVRHPGAVVVLPITDDGKVVFERNVRVAVGQTLLELPAGTLDKGESPAECAARELAEETGYLAGRIEPLLDFFTSPGVLDERIWAFVATGLTPGPSHLDAGEQIVIELIEYEQAVAMCLAGRLHDAKSIAVLLTHRLRGLQ